MPALYGRRDTLALLSRHLRLGHFVLLYGPRGVGKSTMMHALEARCRLAGVAVGAISRTDTLGDLTVAFSRAYPEIVPDGTSSRRTRSRLRMAAEARPCVLLLDHIGSVGTGFKSMLRSLRGTGAGVVLAADADNPREHQRIRELHLTHREVELARLGGTSMRTLFAALLAKSAPRYPLRREDVGHLVRAAEGLPGRAVWFAGELANEATWRDGHVRADWLRTEALARSASDLLTRSAEAIRSSGVATSRPVPGKRTTPDGHAEVVRSTVGRQRTPP